MRELEKLARFYSQIQRVRVAIGNMIKAGEHGRSDAVPAFWQEVHGDLEDVEKQVIKIARGYLKDHPVWPWLERVRGIGETLAARLLGIIGDIARFETESKLFRYAGLAVIDGKAERPIKGERIHYDPQLKAVMFLIGDAFIKQRSPYRRIYDEAKAYYQANREWSKVHCHWAAMRVMEKIFLSHLYLVWREEAGLPVRLPWAIMYGGHLDRYWPWEFVPDYEYHWKEKVLQEWREVVKAKLVGRELAQKLTEIIMAGQGPGYQWRQAQGMEELMQRMAVIVG